MERALSTINQLPAGREQIKSFIAKAKSEILSASDDPLKVLVQLKYAEKAISELLKDKEIEECFIDEFDLYAGEKIVDINGAKLEKRETGTKYDYNASGDPTWMDLDKEIKELTDKRKAREKFLATIGEEGTVDPDTGVFITKAPKSSKTKVIVRV